MFCIIWGAHFVLHFLSMNFFSHLLYNFFFYYYCTHFCAFYVNLKKYDSYIFVTFCCTFITSVEVFLLYFYIFYRIVLTFVCFMVYVLSSVFTCFESLLVFFVLNLLWCALYSLNKRLVFISMLRFFYVIVGSLKTVLKFVSYMICIVMHSSTFSSCLNCFCFFTN